MASEAMSPSEGEESLRCSCEWRHPVDGSIGSLEGRNDDWPAILDPMCPVHSEVEPSTTEGERAVLHHEVAGVIAGIWASDEPRPIHETASKILALLAQPTALSKKWTPAALEEWTPEQWARALDAARTDLMCAEDFEPSDVAHVMNICAQVLRRPQEPIGYIEEDDIGHPRGYVHLTPNPSRVAVFVRPTEEGQRDATT